MRSVIVDLERAPSIASRGDGPAAAALLAAAALFAALVSFARPAIVGSAAAPDAVTVTTIDGSTVQRGVVVHTLRLPAGYGDVELQAMPERLTNEASPSP